MTSETSRTESHPAQQDRKARLRRALLEMLERGDGEDAAGLVAALDWLRRENDERYSGPGLPGGRAAR